MSSAAFLALVFGGFIGLVVLAAIVLLQRPHQTSFAGAMTILGLIGASAAISKTGNYWWGLAIAALALASYFVLQQVVRYSLARARAGTLG